MNRTQEARIFYNLLSAADDEGRICDPAGVERWRALKDRFHDSHCEQEHAELAALLDELDRQGAIVGTWIQARWQAVRQQRPGRDR